MLQVAQSTTGGPPFLDTRMEAALQTFEVGAPLTFALATGMAEAAAAGPFTGFAAEPGHNYATHAVGNNVMYITNTDDVTMQSVMKGAQKTDLIVGDTYNLIKDAALGWIVDSTSQGAAGTCIITAIGPYAPLAQLQTVIFRLASTTRTAAGN